MASQDTLNILSLSADRTVFAEASPAYRKQCLDARCFAHTTALVLNHGEKLAAASADKLDLIPINARSILNVKACAISAAKRVMATRPYGLVICEDPYITGSVGLWLKKEYALPLNVEVFSDCFSDAWVKRHIIHRLQLPKIREVLTAADSIRIVSEPLKKALITRFPHLHSKVFIAPDTFDISPFFKPAHYRPDVSQLLSVGPFDDGASLTALLALVSRHIDTHPQLHLTLITGLSDTETVRDRVLEAGISRHVTVAGLLPLQEYAALFKSHDLLITVTPCRGWGKEYLEALTAGLAIVTITGDGYPGFLQTGVNCLAVPDVTAAASALTDCMTHPEMAYQLAKNGQWWLKQNLEANILPGLWVANLLKYTL